MADEPVLLDYQGFLNVPSPGTLTPTTDAINPDRAFREKVANFDPDVYDLSAESHLTKFLKVLLGDAGVGQLRKRMTISRLEASLLTTRFLNLDRYGGGLFGFRRMADESLWVAGDQTATGAEWDAAMARDVSYLDRLANFLRALPYGASVKGVQLVAGAVLGVDCDIFEAYTLIDAQSGGATVGLTYGDVETNFPEYGAMDGQSYADIEGTGSGFGSVSTTNRNEFVIRPHRQTTPAEAYELLRIVNRIKPAHARGVVDIGGVDVHRPVTTAAVLADSTYWEIVTRVSPRVGTENFYARVDVSGIAVEQPRPAFSRYQGAAWSYVSDVANTTSYAIADDGTVVPDDFEQVMLIDGRIHSYGPDAAPMTPREILAGRAVSDGILVSTPYVPTSDSNSVAAV